jgi:hypothetical protein
LTCSWPLTIGSLIFDLEPNVIQLIDLVDGQVVSFDSFWHTLHQTSKPSESITSVGNHRSEPTTVHVRHGQQTNSLSTARISMSIKEPPIHHLQALPSGLVNYGSGSEYSQTSAIIPKLMSIKQSENTVLTSSIDRPTMQFVSAGFKQPVEYTHLSPREQLAQFQQQESHRIRPGTGYAINKHLRS